MNYKKYHNFSLVLSRKKYGVSAYTLRPYRNPLVLLQSETMNLANLSCLSINRKKYHDFSLVLSRKKTYCVIACTDYPRCDDTH